MNFNLTLLQKIRFSRTLKTTFAYLMTFLLVFQGAIFVHASVLSSQTIQQDFASNPVFIPADNGADVKYITHDFMEASAPQGAMDLAGFYQKLAKDYRQNLGNPTYVPVGTGGITTLIPVYDTPRYIGSAAVQAKYIRAQIQHLLGRNLIDADTRTSDLDYSSEVAQLNTLYRNAERYIQNDGAAKVYGENLGLDQDNSGLVYGAMVWPEFREINNEIVVVPVVYLNNATYQARKVTDHDTTFNGTAQFPNLTIQGVTIKGGRDTFLRVAGDLKNNGGLLHGDGDLKVLIAGSLENVSAKISAGGNLSIGAHDIRSKTIVHRYDFNGRQGGRFGEISTVSSENGDVLLRAYEDILIEGGIVDAGGAITFAANGNIKVGGVQYVSSSSSSGPGWRSSRTQTHFLQSTVSAEDTIKIMAGGRIFIDAAQIASDRGHIELLAGLGITVEDELQQSQYVSHSKWGKTTTDVSAYKTIALRSILDAGKGVRIHADYGDITLKAVDINSTEGTSVKATGGGINMLMTVENDHYSYTSVKESLLTTSVKQVGREVVNPIPNTIIGGFTAEALYGVNVEYEGDPELSFAGQVDELAKMPGLEWMSTVKQDFPEADWVAVERVYNQWDKKSTSLSPAAMALISVAVACATGGASATLSFGVSGSYGVAISAGMSSLISQATLALANGLVNGDVWGAIEDLASEDTLKSLAVTMVTAGAIAQLDATFFDADKLGANSSLTTTKTVTNAITGAEQVVPVLSFTGQAVQAVTNAAVGAGINSVVYGSDFDEALVQSLAQRGIDELGAYMAGEIGSAFDVEGATSLQTALKYISHAGSGCVLGALNSSLESEGDASTACASGAGGAVIGEFIATQYRSHDEIVEAQNAIDEFMLENADYIKDLQDLGYDNEAIYAQVSSITDIKYYTESLGDLQRKGVDLARLGAAIGAFAAGANATDINIASSLGANAAENNALFLIAAVPLVLTAIDVILTGKDLLEIHDAYARGDIDEGNRLLAIFTGETVVGSFIPGDKLLSEIISYAAKHGRDLGKRAASIIGYVERRIDPELMLPGKIPGMDEGRDVIVRMSDGGRGGKSNPLNVPEPNSVYHVDGKYRYETDANGSVVKASGKLELNEGVRNCYQQKLAGNCGLPTDEGGHLIGAQFDGPGAGINLVPQDWQLNRGTGSNWRAMEESWAKALDQNLEVTVEVELIYSSSSVRPDAFNVKYSIDGEPFTKNFPNEPGG